MILVNETDERFYLGPSTLPNAGMGVFTKVSLKKGDHMEIVGVYVGKESVADACTSYAKAYKFAAKAGEDFTRHVIPLGYAAIVNHGSSETRNCELREYRGPKKNPHASIMVYQFSRDIAVGEEILGNYGGTYGVVLEWSDKFSGVMDENRDEWEVFLSYDLYRLGILLGE
jgi:hypothetical protein